MKTTSKRSSPSPRPAGGLTRDVRRLKRDGSASLTELREFVGRMHGKSPQEMLGTVAKSRLAMSICISAIGCLLLLIVCSVIPYLFSDRESNRTNHKAAGSKSNRQPTKAKVVRNDKPAGTNPAAGVPVSPAELAKKLGHTKKKTGTPEFNENLLDGNK